MMASGVTAGVVVVAIFLASHRGYEDIASGLAWGLGVALLIGFGWCLAPQ